MAPQSDSEDWTLVSPPDSSKSSSSSSLVVDISDDGDSRQESDDKDEESYSPRTSISDTGKALRASGSFNSNTKRKDQDLSEIDLNDEHSDSSPVARKVSKVTKKKHRVKFARCTQETDATRNQTSDTADELENRKPDGQTTAIKCPSNPTSLESTDNGDKLVVFTGNQTKIVEYSTQEPSSSRAGPDAIDNACKQITAQSSHARAQAQQNTIRRRRNESLNSNGMTDILNVYNFLIMSGAILTAVLMMDSPDVQQVDLESIKTDRKEESKSKESNSAFEPLFSGAKSTFNLVDVDPASHTYLELKLLDEEIAECIKRENSKLPDDARVMNPSAGLSTKKNDAAQGEAFVHYKPYRGLICYDQESKWRKRFDRLRTKHSLDLARILKQARKRITSEMLETYHPSLRFKLIINQLEYLEFLDQRRRDKTIERVKAENFNLIRRLNQLPHDEHKRQSKDHSALEEENSRLRRENEELKSRLIEKAGTMYIKQSHELEKSDRENDALKQFHFQVAQEVSRALKRLNLHTIDAAAILDDNESLNSQLSTTRGHLIRLGEEIERLMARNGALQDELREIQMMSLNAVRLIQDESDERSSVNPGSGFEVSTVGSVQSFNQNEVTTPSRSISSCGRLTSENNISTLSDEMIVESGDCRGESEIGAHEARNSWHMLRARLRERLRKLEILERQYNYQQDAKAHRNEHELDRAENRYRQHLDNNSTPTARDHKQHKKWSKKQHNRDYNKFGGQNNRVRSNHKSSYKSSQNEYRLRRNEIAQDEFY